MDSIFRPQNEQEARNFKSIIDKKLIYVRKDGSQISVIDWGMYLDKRWEEFTAEKGEELLGTCNSCFRAERIRRQHQLDAEGQIQGISISNINLMFKDKDFENFIIKPEKIKRGKDEEQKISMQTEKGTFDGIKAKSHVYYAECKCQICRKGGSIQITDERLAKAGVNSVEELGKKLGIQIIK